MTKLNFFPGYFLDLAVCLINVKIKAIADDFVSHSPADLKLSANRPGSST